MRGRWDSGGKRWKGECERKVGQCGCGRRGEERREGGRLLEGHPGKWFWSGQALRPVEN